MSGWDWRAATRQVIAEKHTRMLANAADYPDSYGSRAARAQMLLTYLRGYLQSSANAPSATDGELAAVLRGVADGLTDVEAVEAELAGEGS